MPAAKKPLPDFMALYQRWAELKPGPKAELRRIARPQDLIEVPAFYRLSFGLDADRNDWMLRLVFCLPCITHASEAGGLGKALAKAGISEKRLFAVIRSEQPNDLIQLRRLMQQAKPTLNWALCAKQLYYWNDLAKRSLLEEYFLYQQHA